MELLFGRHMRERLDEDLRFEGPCDLIVYNSELQFFEELFGQYANRNKVRILCDWKMRSIVGMFLFSHDKATAKYWPKNGMMHAKVIVFPSRHIVYLGSHNFTWFAWNAAQNMTIRSENVPLTRKVEDRFDYLWYKAAILPRLEPILNRDTSYQSRQQDPSGVSLGCNTEPDCPSGYRVTET